MRETSVSASETPRVNVLLENAIRDIGIPPCPVILEQINAEMRRDEPDLKRLARIIGSDVGLSAGLITITNSPYFGLRTRVRSINEALMILGLSVASRAVAGLVLRKIFPPTPHLERFWTDSARIARISGWLAQQMPTKVRAEDAYTFGLFRDCGIPILLKRFSHYPEVIDTANAEAQASFTAIEDRLCAINHAAVGGLLAQAWWLPDDICLAIRHHHDYAPLSGGETSKTPPRAQALIATALLAERLAQHHGCLTPTQEWHKGEAHCRQQLDLGDEALAELYDNGAGIATSVE